MKKVMAAILIVGAIRFALSVAGAPNSVVKYVSMTAVILAAAIYFSFARETWRERMKAAYFLILPYMVVEVFALGFDWATGIRTIFHTPEYSFRMSLPVHFFGHLIGGLTWEPLSLFVLMQVLSLIRPKRSYAPDRA
jgi:hypothetical protein